jgi:SAM-dependent methyltransferase
VPRSTQVQNWREVLIVRAAVSSGLLAGFATARPPGEAPPGLDPRAARIVAAALHDLGYLEPRGDGALGLSDRGRELLEPPPGLDPVAELELEARAMASHLGLAEVLHDGVPRDDVSGGDPATRRVFMRAMRSIAGPRVPESVGAVGPPPPGGRLLDVGGAPGTYARAFAEAGWDVTVLDLPETLAVGEEELRAAGVAAVAGDATEALPEGPWQAVYLGNVVHLFGPEEAAALVARAGAALAPGGILAVQEVLLDRSPQGPGFGVMMLLSTPGGDVYATADYAAWMEAAGCPLERAVALEEGWHHLLIGRRDG